MLNESKVRDVKKMPSPEWYSFAVVSFPFESSNMLSLSLDSSDIHPLSFSTIYGFVGVLVLPELVETPTDLQKNWMTLKLNMPKEKNKNIFVEFFKQTESCFLERLDYNAKMILELTFVGGKLGLQENLNISNVELGTVQPVVWDSSKKISIRFSQPLAFQRIDESFAFEKSKSYTGENFREYSDSEYLKYYLKINFGLWISRFVTLALFVQMILLMSSQLKILKFSINSQQPTH